MEYAKRLYLILYPNVALIASQYVSERFAKHYSVGSTRYYHGKVIFAEVDINFRHPYFELDEILEEVKPHENGRPKATKFISSYRVLEHIDFAFIKNLYLASPEGYTVGLEEAPYRSSEKPGQICIFVEIAPIRMMVLSDYDFIQFGKHVTAPKYRKGAPKVFYSQLDLDIGLFIQEFEQNPFRQSPVLSIHPASLRDAYKELVKYPDKHTKGLCVDSSLDKISFKQIRNGFMFASQEETKFYPMPSMRELEEKHYKFWKNI